MGASKSGSRASNIAKRANKGPASASKQLVRASND